MPLTIRPSTLLTFGLVWAVLYAQLSDPVVGLSLLRAVVVTTLTSVAFFVSIIAHELAHAVMARLLDLPVTGVTVFSLGGITRLGDEPAAPVDEYLVAIAGPLTNLLLGGLLLAAGVHLGAHTLTGVLLRFLGDLNAAIGVFNLLPGHPLDGGAMLRAGMWRLTGDRLVASRTVARLGQALAFALVGGGVVGGLTADEVGAGVGPWWLAVVGLFMLAAARNGLVQANVRAQLDGLRVADLVRGVGWQGEQGWTVARVVADVARRGDGLVLDHDHAVGTFGPDQLATIPSAAWEQTTLGETMQRVAGHAEDDEPLVAVLDRFGRTSGAVLAVTGQGAHVGVLNVRDVVARLRGPQDG